LMGGGLICIAFLLFLPDEGISEIFRVIGEADKISFAPWDFDFSQLTVIVLVINGIFYAIQKYGTDQTIVQRYLAASSDKKAIRASFIGVLLSVPLWTMFMFIGTLLYAYYQLSPELLTEGMLAEGVFPYFIATELWVVLKGFIIAALIAAAISTISSDFNCLSAIGVTDFYERFKSKVTDAQKLKMGRIIIVASGVLAAFIGTLYVKWGGEGVSGVIFGLYAIFSAGIVGMFLLGLIVRRANTKGLYIGMIACVLFTAWGTLTTTEVNTEGIPGVLWDLGQFNFPHHTYMLGVYSHIVLFVFGWLGSYFFKPQHVAENLYIYEFIRRKKEDEL
jgi:solute:Na+ symporter, SSS family